MGRLLLALNFMLKESRDLKVWSSNWIVLLLSEYLLRWLDYFDFLVFMFDKNVQLIQICSHLLHFLLSPKLFFCLLLKPFSFLDIDQFFKLLLLIDSWTFIIIYQDLVLIICRSCVRSLNRRLLYCLIVWFLSWLSQFFLSISYIKCIILVSFSFS